MKSNKENMTIRQNKYKLRIEQFLVNMGIGVQGKMIAIFLIVQIIPVILLSMVAWKQINVLGEDLRDIAVNDSSQALNDSAVENIERLSTDAANKVADFLYGRDRDILYLASLVPSEETYYVFGETQKGRIIQSGTWELASDEASWICVDAPEAWKKGGISTNSENDDKDGFHYREPEIFSYMEVPLYDEITFVDLTGMETIKYVSPDSPKKNYPMSQEKKDISKRENTYVKTETYFEEVKNMQPGEIYVSDVTGAYVKSNYIGMYAPEILKEVSQQRGYEIPFNPEEQAYAGEENPNGQRFEGIVRWATPVAGDDGEVIGYVTFALNHDHIMEIVDHLTPMNERYTHLPSAYEGNYAFIWDYQCRNIVHPRHHSIVGVNPETGDPEIPWLETSIYEGWQASGEGSWMEYVKDIPIFDEQSREKTPASELTKAGLVGLDGRYLNNAPQCTGWMDLTREGGSGSFYILWSGIYKLNTAAAIPYYTGQYAPSEENDYSRRGFGFVAVGSGIDDFTRPAEETKIRLTDIIQKNQSGTTKWLVGITGILVILMIFIAIWVATSITNNIKYLIAGVSRFRAGERQFRFDAEVKDEFGTLADSFDDMANSIVDSVKNPLSIIDMNHKIIYMNEYALAVCQTGLSDIVGNDYGVYSIYPADSKFDPVLALEEGEETRIYYEEESGLYLKGTASYLCDKDGNRAGYMIETADVTQMVLEQIEIEEQKSLLDKVFSASPDLIWYKNARGAYFTVNPRFASLLGVDVESFSGKTAEEMFPTEIARRFAEQDKKVVQSRIPLYSEETLEFADGHQEILDLVRTPIYDAAGTGTLVGILGFARDVTVRVSMEDELRKTQLDLEEAVKNANRANTHKSEFLARMSHEIRTPMNGIIGVTNIVQRKLEECDGSQQKLKEIEGYVDQIEGSSQHLLGLLNDILDISKIEAGKIELIDEVVELSKLAEVVTNIIRPRCDDKNIRFTTNFDEFAPVTFSTDALRLRQVLINLLGNAVKFTPECGTIEFSMKKVKEENSCTQIKFSVKDTGIGIPKESQATIFESFEQGGTNLGAKQGGTGLGLAISQRIVQLFGGDITLESTLGQGSTFSFLIWLDKTDKLLTEEVRVADVTGKFVGCRMLLVDDVEVNRMIVAALLEDSGIMIDEAEDGMEALALFEKSEPDFYDLILMDVQMPIMDGYEATVAIRHLSRPDASTVPIVALTANAFREDVEKALSYGMNGHMAKPIEMQILFKTLFHFMNAELDK